MQDYQTVPQMQVASDPRLRAMGNAPRPNIPLTDEVSDRIAQTIGNVEELSGLIGALHGRLFGPVMPLGTPRVEDGNKASGAAEKIRLQLSMLEDRIKSLRYLIEQVASQV